MKLVQTTKQLDIKTSTIQPRHIPFLLHYCVGIILLCAASSCATATKSPSETNGSIAATQKVVRPKQSVDQTVIAGDLTDTTATHESTEPRTQSRASNPVSNQLRTQAQQAIEDGELEQADRLLDRALRIDPRDPATYFLVAKLREQQNQVSAALQLVEKALSLKPAAKLEAQLESLRDSLSSKKVES